MYLGKTGRKRLLLLFVLPTTDIYSFQSLTHKNILDFMLCTVHCAHRAKANLNGVYQWSKHLNSTTDQHLMMVQWLDASVVRHHYSNAFNLNSRSFAEFIRSWRKRMSCQNAFVQCIEHWTKPTKLCFD